MILIYALVCPFTGDIRYIGKTERRIETRLSAHLAESRVKSKQSHKHRWIRKCLAEKLMPSALVLEEVQAGVRWQDRERAWIARAVEMGLPLTNQTKGGEGLDFFDPEERARYLAKLSASIKAVQAIRPEIKAAREAGGRRSWKENREFRLAALAAGCQTEEAKENLAKAMAEVRSRPGYKEERSRNAKRIWDTSRDKIMTAFATPEVKAKHSARAKRCWNDPETRDRMMNRWSPEAKEKQRQIALSPERKEQIAKAMTPEVRARQGSKMKEHWARLTPEERAAIRDKSQANKTPEGKARHSARMKKYWADKRAEKAASFAKTGSSKK